MASVVTPYRTTYLRFDVPEPVGVEVPFSMSRSGQEMGRGQRQGSTIPASSWVQLLDSGAWCLTPLNDIHSLVSEMGDVAGAVIRASALHILASVIEQPRWKSPSDIPDATTGADPGLAATGDYYLNRRFAAGVSWEETDLAADVASYGQPTQSSENLKLDRMAVGKETYRANQGFTLRWQMPATQLHNPDNLFTFYFGGAAMVNGAGQFAVTISGSGIAKLYERVMDGSWVWGWQPRALWRYCDQTPVGASSHTMRIMPHASGRNGYIEFRGDITDDAGKRGASGKVGSTYVNPPSSPQKYLYKIPNMVAGGRTNVTGDGTVRLDVRRDLRMWIQMATTKFPASGELYEAPFVVSGFVTPRSNLILYWVGTTGAGTSITGKLYNAADDTELTSVSSGAGYAEYEPVYGQQIYYARFTLAGDASDTPYLWSYRVVRNGVYVDAPHTEFTGGMVQDVSISGPEGDTTHETATVAIEDPTNELSLLRTRAGLPAQIEVGYDPNNPSLRSVLCRGYAIRNTATRKGTNKKVGMGNSGADRVYPSPDWNAFQSTWVGMWKRLEQTMVFDRQSLIEPLTDQPYKVTDVVRNAFGWAGFPLTMIDVPDLPIRFWPTLSEDNSDLFIDPLTSIGTWIAQTVKDYLAHYVVWDGNAGASGMWRVLPANVAPYTNLAQFVTTGPGALKLQMNIASHGTNIAPIVKGTLRTWVKEPEANFVMVVGVGQGLHGDAGPMQLRQFMVNPKATNFYTESDGTPILTADPTHPDYTNGTLRPLVILDPTANTQDAVDFLCRRYYDLTCHAIKCASFTAPLLLVWEAADTQQTQPRPLRYYDPVLIDANQFLLRNCNPSYRKDTHQFAVYEVESPRV